MEPQAAKSSNELAQDRTDLAVSRTLMAASRSLMAWVRTGLSMIGFGFTIYKFLSSGAGPGWTNEDPAQAGLFLIGLGIVSIIFGAVEYTQTVGDLRREYRCKYRKYPLIMAFLVGGLGLTLLIEALLNRT
jgi:putative membrane protein